MAEYRVEEETKACKSCGMGSTWIIVDSDNIGGGTTYSDKEIADDICELMNDAYERGRVKVLALH